MLIREVNSGRTCLQRRMETIRAEQGTFTYTFTSSLDITSFPGHRSNGLGTRLFRTLICQLVGGASISILLSALNNQLASENKVTLNFNCHYTVSLAETMGAVTVLASFQPPAWPGNNAMTARTCSQER